MKTSRLESVWDAIEDTPQEAANMRARSELMMQIEELINSASWTQAEIAERCGVTQPRISDLLRGKIQLFSLDALVNIAASLGARIHIEIDTAS